MRWEDARTAGRADEAQIRGGHAKRGGMNELSGPNRVDPNLPLTLTG